LRRDRNKRVTEVWVRWQERSHLFFSGREDRHYAIDRARGRLLFGNGLQGKIPPAGATILARQHRAGGGLVGNVAGRTITQLLAGVAGVQAVFNPRPGEGGADGETVESFGPRGPKTVRHRGRAIAPADYQTLAREASPAVAAARAIPTRNARGRIIPGWVTLVIIPQSQDPRPWPSFGLRQQVYRSIVDRAPADLAAANQIYVTGPAYLPIDVAATIAPVNPAEAGAVEERARAVLGEFLHPLHGGPDRRGWEIGRDVFLSDVAAVLERVPGVDYVEELALLLNGGVQGERIAVDEDHIVVAGMIRLRLKAAER
jgi:predicted phage baseplate assembly protein